MRIVLCNEVVRELSFERQCAFAALRAHFDDRAIIELSGMNGTYNMHNRALQALQIDLEKAN